MVAYQHLSRTPGAHEDYERLATVALEGYGLAGYRLDFLRGGARKQLLRVETAAGDELVLRMYLPPELHDLRQPEWVHMSDSESALCSQALWLAALRRESPVRAPEPVPAADGSLVVYASVEEVARPAFCLLLRWVPGSERLDPAPGDLSLAGACMARLHDHAEGYEPPEDFVRPRWGWDYLFAESELLWRAGRKAYTGAEMEVFRSASERIWDNLQALGERPESFGLIHRDIQPSNVVFREGEASVIDFDQCGWGYYLYDLAHMLLKLERFGERCASLQAALLRGYDSVRPLSASHLRYLETFIAMRVFEKINQDLGRGDLSALPGVAASLSKSARRIENFVARDGESRLKTALLPGAPRPFSR